MKITEYKNDLTFSPPQFNCDGILNDRVKYPLPGCKEDPKCPFILIAGAAGSGKTSLSIGLLTEKDMYRKALIMYLLSCQKIVENQYLEIFLKIILERKCLMI